MADLRVEFRITNLGVSANAQQIFSLADTLWCSVLPNSAILQIVDFYEPGSPSIVLDLTGRTDVVIRYQKSAGGSAQAELWNADGSGYRVSSAYAAVSARDLSGPINLGFRDNSSFLLGQMAYFRGYSSTVPVGAARPNNVAAGDLFDYEFEGSANDSSGNQANLAITGLAGYTTTPFETYVPQDFTMTAGRALVLDGSGSGASTYLWQQTAGAEDCALGAASMPSVSLTGCAAFGQRTFLLTATSPAGQTSQATVNVGVVPAAEQGVVQVDDPAVNFMLGPMLRFGITAWSNYDRFAAEMADYWYGDPANSRGNAQCQAEQNGCAWNTTDVETSNYYDAVLVLYQMYSRTGLTRYQTEARALALFFWNTYWTNGAPPGGCASNFVAPRDSAAAGMILTPTIRRRRTSVAFRIMWITSSTTTWSCAM